MGTRTLAQRLAFFVVAALGAACSPLGGQGSVPPAGTPPGSQAVSAQRHLYVIVTTKRRFVAVYPIRDGVPESTPDRTVLGLHAPNAIAVDNVGDLFVLDLKTLKEFAPGASGNARPIREIDLTSFLNIDTLAIDARGYLYVGQSRRVYVFAPGAHGRATPIARIRPAGYPAGFTIGEADDFYSLGNTQTYDPYLTFQTHVSIYSAAPKLRRVRAFCTYELPQSGIDYGVALDGRGSTFTAHTYFVNSYPQGEIDVFPPGADRCPMRPGSKITTTNPTLREPVYLAIDGPYLYVGDVFYGGGGVVFALRTTGTQQTPLGILYVVNHRAHNIFGIAAGP